MQAVVTTITSEGTNTPRWSRLPRGVPAEGQKVMPTDEALAALVEEATPPDVKRMRWLKKFIKTCGADHVPAPLPPEQPAR